MTKKILITGVSGFIGNALASQLKLVKALHVLGIDLPGRKSDHVNFFPLDLLDEGAVLEFLRKHRPGVIFHLAGGRLQDAQAMFSANVKTTQTLFAAILSITGYRPRVVVMGSAAEYGVCSGTERITEKMSGKVDGPYGQCKLVQTQTSLYFSSIGVDVVVARLFNILGPGLPAATVGGAFAKDIVAIERDARLHELQVGNLKAVRDFLDIRDICSALFFLAEKGQSGEIYNICSQKGVLIRGLLSDMIKCSCKKKILVREGSKKSPGVLSSIGSCAKLKKETGWRPKYTLQESVADTLEYYRSISGVR
ncbi:MAG: NAD(P)-dependent oxidoreductase [Candidatus Omnitrophica bacterium]|nr:NAD(P)-dependent oxidoreductase [Candidatus Omnitrophota bacterium]